jgi:hypothetical protein
MALMNFTPDTREVLCCPTALLPLGLSLGALLVVLVHVASFGPVHGPEEDAIAHIWQILMLVQIPALALFLGRWFRKARRSAFQVLTLQGAAIAISVVTAALPPVHFVHL